jgi:Metallo-beta-lactamase superfamily
LRGAFLFGTGLKASVVAQALCLHHIRESEAVLLAELFVDFVSDCPSLGRFLASAKRKLRYIAGPERNRSSNGKAKNMTSDFLQKQTGRRAMLRDSATLAGSAFLAHLFPGALRAYAAAGYGQQTAPAGDSIAAIRAQIGAIPIQTQKLADNLTLLSGPGGNVLVLNGADGKIVVDTFLSPAWPKLKETLDGIGSAPLKTVIDTHWHFDHTDNNGALHAAGATVLAHENTKKRMSETHDLPVMGLHFAPSPAEACRRRHLRRATSCKPMARR